MNDLHFHRLQSARRRVIARLRKEQGRAISDLARVRKLKLKADRLRDEIVRAEPLSASL